MRPVGERALLGLVLAAIPVLVGLLVVRPATRRLAALHRRIEAAHADTPGVTPFVPVSREERALLEDPGAPWRTRLPLVADDAARLAQVDRVINEVRAALAARKVRAAGMRLLLDPVHADFSFPDAPTRAARPPRPAADAPDLRVAGWALEVTVTGPTRDLFQALAAVPGVNALLEPGGLRWEVGPEPAPGPRRSRRPAPDHRQALVLRNFYLKPGG